MGPIFFVFGLNMLLSFIPQPKDPMPEGAVAFVSALITTGISINSRLGLKSFAARCCC
jgi:hypothetical protein